MSKALFLLLFTVVLTISLFFYYFSFNFYFFQDDFFHLNISRIQSLSDFIGFFKLRNDIIGYRPVSIQLFFSLSYLFFKLDPAGFRVISLSLLFSSFFLIIVVFKKITSKLSVGFLTASFWITSSVHFMTVTWISAAYNIIGTFFWLLTSLAFLNFISTQKKTDYFLTVVFFSATIGSFEFAVTWPVIFGFYYLFVLKKTFKQSLKVFSPVLVILVFYLIGKIFFMRIPQLIEYQLTFNIDSIKGLLWYFLWAFNIPEEFKKQIIGNLFMFNPKFLMEYNPLVTKSFLGLFAIILLGIIYPLISSNKKIVSQNTSIIIFGVIWFIVGIFPVLLLPNHTFLMYLTLSSIGLYFLIAYLILNFSNKKLVLLIFTIWLFTSYTTLSFYKINSWMLESQKFAKNFSHDMISLFPSLPDNSVVLYELSDHRFLQSLLGQNAIRSIYANDSISIYYNKEDLLSNLEGLKERPIYIFVPK